MDPILELLRLGIKLSYVNPQLLGTNPISLLLRNINKYNNTWLKYANKVLNLPFGQDVVWTEFSKKYGDYIIKPEDIILRVEKAFKQKWGEDSWNEVNILVNEEIGKISKEIEEKINQISKLPEISLPNADNVAPDILNKQLDKLFKGNVKKFVQSGTPEELQDWLTRRGVIDNYWDGSDNVLKQIWDEEGIRGVRRVLVMDGYEEQWANAVDKYFREGKLVREWEK